MILRIIFHTVSLSFTFLRVYVYYRRNFRKYVRIVKKAMIRNGLPRKMAKKLCAEMQPLRLQDFMKFAT